MIDGEKVGIFLEIALTNLEGYLSLFSVFKNLKIHKLSVKIV